MQTVSIVVLGAVAILAVYGEDNCPVTFKNTPALVTFLKGQRRMIFNRCAGAELHNAVEISVKNQDLPILEQFAINYINTLETATFDNCNIYKLKVNIFFGLPNLRTVRIVHNNLAIISSNIFSNVTAKVLELTDNKLYNIYRDAFSDAKQLETVKLNKNELSHYFPEWFKSSETFLQHLDLSENQLVYLPNEAFKLYKNLETLKLGHNRLRSLHPDVFKNLGKLKSLDLSHNRIAEFYRYITDPFSQSRITIKLNNNRLNYLIEANVRHLRFGKVYLHSNPWKCACYKRIAEWSVAYEVDVILNSECANNELFPVCIEQEQHPKKCTQEVDSNITKIYYNHYHKVPCEYNL